MKHTCDMAKKPKVLVIYHFFPHYRKGVLTALQSSENLEVEFAAADNSDQVDPGIKPCTTEDLPALHVTPLVVWGRNLLWQQGLGRIIFSARFDAVIFLASPYFLSTWFWALILLLSGRRSIFWGHLLLPARDNMALRFLKRRFYSLADVLLPYGHTAKNALVAAGFSEEKVHVVYNSLDHNRTRQLRAIAECIPRDAVLRGLFADSAKPVLICISRLTSKRRLDLVLDAMVTLRNQFLPCNLLLVGDGPQRAELEQRAKAEDLDVTFYGACYDENSLARLYGASDVTVAPGEVGLTGIQSLGYGVPVVTHSDPEFQMPEAEAVIDHITGRLFTRNSSLDLARVLLEIFRPRFDKERWRSACYKVIDEVYNPACQCRVIERAVTGDAPDESKWLDLIKVYSHREKIDS
jgi:glycosyltransferase involved in cell wall biosynthesis